LKKAFEGVRFTSVGSRFQASNGRGKRERPWHGYVSLLLRQLLLLLWGRHVY